MLCLDFPGGSDGKASVYNVGDLGSILGLGKASVYNVGDLGSILGLGISLEKEMATHSSTLA